MRRDMAAGGFFLVISLFFLVFGLQLPMGTAARVGPGFLPVGAGALLLVLALVILGQAFLARPGPRADAINWRGLAAITGSVLVFALALHPLGMVVTTLAAVMVAGFAEKPYRAVELLLLGLFLAVSSVVVFIYGIGMLIPVWPNL